MGSKPSRTLSAVFHPRKFAPFPGLTDRQALDQAWQENPIWVHACMAHAAYRSREENELLFRSLGVQIRYYQSGFRKGIKRGREAILAIWDDKAILAFQGTVASKGLRVKTPKYLFRLGRKIGLKVPEDFSIILSGDVIDDLRATKIDYKGARVHKGFFRATGELWNDIEKDLVGLNLTIPQEVYATGHSLGGAMAVVAGMKYPFKQVVTFGEPKVGNGVEGVIACRHIRYVNGKDIVPRIIPKFLSFKHHGEEQKVQDESGTHLIRDHSIVNYAEIVK